MTFTKTAKPTASWDKGVKPYPFDNFLFQDGNNFLFQDGNYFVFERDLTANYTKTAKP